MPESDVTKMKVADLKRELKLRGLPINGNKNELQDRLQTALLEGDISLEDSAIADAIVDAIDDDVSLTDEDEHKLLCDDHEDLLLKSPVSTPTDTTTIPELLTTEVTAEDLKPVSLSAKKIVLKRNNSLSLATAATTATTTTSKENAAPEAAAGIKDVLENTEVTPAKTKHKPIVVGGGAAAENKEADKKMGELSIQERLELRAKKFGIVPDAKAAAKPTTGAGIAPSAVNKSSSASIKANKGNKETDEQQKEALKRRAERFGCVVPEKSPKILGDERLQKRKERFGGTAADASTATAVVTATDAKGQGAWAEKARARLERFKEAPAAAADATEK